LIKITVEIAVFRATSILLALGLLSAMPTDAGAAPLERAYWVWHRVAPLTAEEKAELTRQEVKTLFWSVGEMEQRGGVWTWKNPPTPPAALAPGFRVVPVVRLNPAVRVPFPAESLPALVEKLRAVAGSTGDLQLDFDCPDRLLPEYAAALRVIRRTLPRVSITALTHWARLPSFADLARSVPEITPMFYDMQGDPGGVGPKTPPPPILDPAQVAAALRDWKACGTPWRAGLPTFARLTIFDQKGASRGQIPNWTWEDFCFHPGLHTLGPTRLGVTLLQVEADTRIASTPVAAGEIVASRFTDREALAQMVTQAQEAGASGVSFFRLPDGTDPAGYSPGDLGQLSIASKPRLILRPSKEGGLELINDSPFDLAPRLSGERDDRDRGYALELDMPAPVFREALRGDFWRVTSHTNPDAKTPTAAVVPLATRLTFWFADLRAGAVRRTGLLQLAPGATLETVRYRVLHCEGASSWKPIPTTAP
jgi:hypothetical protein